MNIDFWVTMLYIYGTPAIVFFTIIFGVITIFRKDVPTKLLGVWLVTWSIANLLNYASGTVGMVLNMDNVANYLSISSVARSILGAVGLLGLFLYAKIRYRAKGLIAIIILKLAESPLVMLFNYIWQLIAAKYDLTNDQFAFGTNIIREAVTLIVLIIIFSAYVKHSKTETDIRKMWIFPFFLVLFSIGTIGLNAYTFIMIKDNNLADITNGYYDLIELAIADLPLIIEFIAAIYIVAKGRRPFARKKRAEK